MKHILATGGKGQLGIELCRFPWPDGWVVTAVDIDELDLRDPAAIAAIVASRPWSAVINAGAYTAVDRAEGEIAEAWAVNALAPAAFAGACAPRAIPLIQISTDYVFDGSRQGRWETGDLTNPLGVYGASKLGGELAVRTGCVRHAIVRTSWLVSAHGSNFVKTMLRLGATNERIRVVSDQFGAPTSAGDLAAAIATIAIRMASDPASPTGTFHFSNGGEATWSSFAEAIFAGAAARGRDRPEVVSIASTAYPTPAQRPKNSLFSHRAIYNAYGMTPRPWEDALSDILDELIGTAS